MKVELNFLLVELEMGGGGGGGRPCCPTERWDEGPGPE